MSTIAPPEYVPPMPSGLGVKTPAGIVACAVGVKRGEDDLPGRCDSLLARRAAEVRDERVDVVASDVERRAVASTCCTSDCSHIVTPATASTRASSSEPITNDRKTATPVAAEANRRLDRRDLLLDDRREALRVKSHMRAR
ncbi:hypothetical protein [Paraburkholderia sp. SOS3]|uniref:hypothetical protein n=1 Tax=Paraburkholderia sp. SOS3 TaxID=1926494 RepID=UPI0018DCC5A0|nr:hypothetical protein [Paraburkholderia sp. SOS3]